MSAFIQTISGKRIDFHSVSDNDFDIEDIAHALSNINRFVGHTNVAWSVAEHSLFVVDIMRQVGSSKELSPTEILEGLLHDASEAYLGDISRPLKALLPEYQALERRFVVAIREAFALRGEHNDAVHFADMVALVAERQAFVPNPLPIDLDTKLSIAKTAARLHPKIRCKSPEVARQEFLRVFAAADVQRWGNAL